MGCPGSSRRLLWNIGTAGWSEGSYEQGPYMILYNVVARSFDPDSYHAGFQSRQVIKWPMPGAQSHDIVPRLRPRHILCSYLEPLGAFINNLSKMSGLGFINIELDTLNNRSNDMRKFAHCTCSMVTAACSEPTQRLKQHSALDRSWQVCICRGPLHPQAMITVSKMETISTSSMLGYFGP